MNSVQLALVSVLASCGSSVDVHAGGSMSGARTFYFRNAVALTVESSTGSFDWSEHDVRDGDDARAAYSELRVELRSGGFLATDRQIGKGRLRINGAIHEGSAFRLHDDGSVEDTSGRGAASVRMR